MIEKDPFIPKSKRPTDARFASDLNALGLLETMAQEREVLKVRKGTQLFTQGTDADAIYFVESGCVKVTIRSVEQVEAVLSLRGPGDIFGEGCLVGHSLRMGTATATESSTVFKTPKHVMLEAFRASPGLSEKFIASVVARNLDEESIASNHLFSHPEKRLAHILLKLNRYSGPHLLRDFKRPEFNFEAVATLIGTTPSRVTCFLDKFRRLGLIHDDANGAIVVRAEMLTDIVLAARPVTPVSDPLMARTTVSGRTLGALLSTVRRNERNWTKTSYAGVSLCKLFEDTPEGHGAILVKMTAGARYPDHRHEGREQLYVIEGAVKVGRWTLRAGDYHRAEASTYHRQVSTDTGCVCIMFGYVGSISVGRN